MKRRLALNFKGVNDASIYMIAFKVVQDMSNNEYFSDPGMLIIELRETTKQFEKAMVDAGTRDMIMISIKNKVRELLIGKLKEIGAFVEGEAKGAETALFSSGFPMRRPLDEIKLKEPRDFTIEPGPKPGEIEMKVRGVKGARSYLYQWTPAPFTAESVWETAYDTRCKRVISGLPLGINYCFRMAAVGARNQIVYTQVLSRYIS